MMIAKRITLRAWAESNFSPPPSVKTLQRWARDCWIFPIPQKVGRAYYVFPDARFIGDSNGPKTS